MSLTCLDIALNLLLYVHSNFSFFPIFSFKFSDFYIFFLVFEDFNIRLSFDKTGSAM